VDHLDELLLGHAAALTREQVNARSGVPDGLAVDIWAAMGFAEIPHGETAFTEADVQALQTAASLVELGVIDVDSLLVMARAMGQGLARLAEAQVDVLRGLAGELDLEGAIAAIADSGEEVLNRLDLLMVFVWRRQFAAAVQRSIAAARKDGMPLLAVGFLDLVGFTKSTRSWDAGQLERTLERFERDTSLRVAAVGGRVVKTLGDGVLFTTDKAQSAVEVALTTARAHALDPDLPEVRGGIALGPVLVRLGDVFGEPVNLASRLADEARAGSVVVDKSVAAELDDTVEVRELHRRSVRGYRALTPYLVRPAG